MKVCTRCNIRKDLSKFQIRKASKDGLSASCKTCLAGYDKTRANLTHRVEARKEYAKTEAYRISHNKAGRRYSKTDKGKISGKKWSKSNQFKRKAHGIVAYQVKVGSLVKQPCELCGEVKVEAHHADYEKPLEVNWLCRKCHTEHHKKLRSVVLT